MCFEQLFPHSSGKCLFNCLVYECGLLVEKKKDGQMDRQTHRTVDTQHRLLICWQKMYAIDFVQVTEMGLFLLRYGFDAKKCTVQDNHLCDRTACIQCKCLKGTTGKSITVRTGVKYLLPNTIFLSDGVIFDSDRVLNKFSTVRSFCTAIRFSFSFASEE